MKNLNKHFTAITGGKNITRPILTGVHYNHTTDELEATDGHRLLTFKAEYEILESFILNLNTLERIEGEYPNVERLIPNVHETYFTAADINPTLLKVIAAYKKDLIQLNYSDAHLTIAQENGNLITNIPLHDFKPADSNEPMYMNGQYFYDALAFLLDYTKICKTAEIRFTYISRVRPVSFSTVDFTYLITPVRKY